MSARMANAARKNSAAYTNALRLASRRYAAFIVVLGAGWVAKIGLDRAS